MIKAVIFDCFGVLTTDTWRAFLDSLPKEADIERARELNKQLDSGLIEHDAFLKQVHDATGAFPTEVEKLKNSEIAKNLPLLDYISDLKERGLAIGMISNIATNWVRDTFLSEAEQDLFDEMIFSYEVGMTKPDSRIYMLACERLRVGPHETIFVDDILSYCEAAEEEGLHAVHYKDFRQMKAEIEELITQKAEDKKSDSK